MHIRYLDLIAYGHFADRRIGFRSDAKVHLIYGPNEAGKSTVLQAIGDLLFDFPQRYTGKARHRPVDFRFRLPELRLGGELLRKDGATLAFVRRKANKAALSDPDTGETLPDDALDAFLGGLDRERFIREHGLDAETLRQGGAVLAGETDADLGGSLLAASSGLVGLRRLQLRINEEADDIFKPRSQKSQFALARAERDAARNDERDTDIVLSAREWRDNEAAIRDNAVAQDETRQKLAQLDQRHRDLSRRIALRPALRHLDEARRDLAVFDDLADLPDGLADRIDAALAEQDAASRALADAETRRTRLTEQLERYAPDQALVAAMPAVKELAENLGAFREWQEHTPKLTERLTTQKAEEARWWRELDPKPDGGGLALPSIAERSHLNQQALRLQRLLASRQSRFDEMAELAERMRREDNTEDAKALPDLPRSLRLAADLSLVFEPLDQAIERRAEAQRAIVEAGEAALRLDPPVEALAYKIGLVWPSDSDIDEALGRHTALTTDQSRLETRLAELESAMAEGRSRAGEGDAAEQLLDRMDLQNARMERDSGLAHLQAGRGDWADALKVVAAADRIADRLIDDADAMAARRQERVERERLASQRNDIVRQLETARQAMDRWQEDWATLFETLSVKPPASARAANWMGRLRSLRDAVAAANASQDKADSIIDRAEGHRPALLELAASVVLPDADTLAIDILWRAVARRLDGLAQEDRARQTERAVMDERRKSYGHAESEYQRLSAEIAAMRTALKADLSGFSLPNDVMPETVFAILEGFNNLSETRAKIAETERRLAGIDDKNAAFRRSAQELIERLMPDAAGDSLDSAVGTLRDRCEEATSLARRVADLRGEYAEADEALSRAKTRGQEAEATLAACAALLPEGTELPAVAERLRERERAARTLVEQQRRFSDLADGLPEEDVRQAVEAMDQTSARDELMRLEDEKGTAEEERERHRLEAGRLLEKKATLGARRGSELAAFRRQAAEERMANAAREWGRLRAASILLDAAMDHYARSVPNAALTEAGRLFETLTGGAFSGLSEDLDSNGKPILIVQRADGGTMPVSGTLSEGTGDQLYLALRLAWLKERAERNDLPPFIGDDLFASFDDDRTEAGLRAFAEIAPAVQPILFTHHKAVAETAQRTLGDGLDLIEL